ncbi:MAG: mechanosensitive ion channel family protein [Dehalococcoidia bacterium]|nr:mechanosensitive ion channel family protein [Dehalococcoidia bacterium]
MPLLTSDWDEFQDWLTRSGKDILIIAGILLAAYVLFRALFPRVARAAIMRGGHPADDEMERRANTIIGVIDRTAGLAVLLIGLVTILPELGINITAIVTGLGVTGLALALGAQLLVRDAINGIFLLAEDQYRRGDVIRIADVTGTVEEITLRRTIIRDDDGVVHSVPNGSISVVSNYTRDFARVNLPVRVSYGEDLARVSAVVEQVGRELTADSRYGPLLTQSPRTCGVEEVGESGVTLTVTAETRPAARWEVAAELRRRLADAFLAQGIRVPFPTLPGDESSRQASPAEGD